MALDIQTRLTSIETKLTYITEARATTEAEMAVLRATIGSHEIMLARLQQKLEQ